MFGKKILTGLMIGLLGLGCATTAWATEIDDNILVDGQDGDIVWTVYKDGLLTLEGEGDYKPINTWDTPPWVSYRDKITTARVNVSGITSTMNMFNNLNKLTNIDLSGLDTSSVTNMEGMFRYCNNLTELDLSNFDTSNVTNMSEMFDRCRNLTELNLGDFNTSKVTNMEYMFYGCSSLESLDLSSFDTANVTNMGVMFYNCKKLKSLDVSEFNTSKVTSIRGMFGCCVGLENLDVSNFDTSNVIEMSREEEDLTGESIKILPYGVFYGCSNLKSLDLSSWNVSNVTDMTAMFYGCSSLESLDLSSWDMSKVNYVSAKLPNDYYTYSGSTTYSIFDNCCSLKRLYTPTNLNLNIELPQVSSSDYDKNWYIVETWDTIGELPKNTEESALLLYTTIDISLEGTELNENHLEIKTGNTLTANVKEIDNSETVDYSWYIKDETEPFSNGKELALTSGVVDKYDLINKEIYCKANNKLISGNVLVVKGREVITNSGDCNIEVSQGQSFSVTIPAFISMNGEKNNDNINSAMFKTIIVADIAGGDSITIEPVSLNVTLSQVGKKDLNATITANEKGWIHSINQNGDTEESLKAGVTREHTISVANLSAGRWRGTFNWNIITTGNKIDDSVEHVDYKQYDSKTKAWTDVE